MKHKLFFFYCMALISFLFVVVGVLDLVGVPHTQIGFWDGSAIEADGGRIAWIGISAACLVAFLTMAGRAHRS
jgi:hypothetical protein